MHPAPALGIPSSSLPESGSQVLAQFCLVQIFVGSDQRNVPLTACFANLQPGESSLLAYPDVIPASPPAVDPERRPCFTKVEVALLELTRKQAELESREKELNEMSGTLSAVSTDPSTAGGGAATSSALSAGES